MLGANANSDVFITSDAKIVNAKAAEWLVKTNDNLADVKLQSKANII